MFQSRVIQSILKRNNKTYLNSLLSNYKGTTTPFTVSSASSSSSTVARSSLYGFRSLLKGNYVSSFRNLSTTAAAVVGVESKEGLKVLVREGPRAQKMVGIWLFGSAAWVFSMVVLGGMTRLTRSGLSMTDWKFTGGLPPISDKEWLTEFEKYKQSPEYKRNRHLNIISLDGLFGTALSVVMPEPPAESVAWVRGAAKVKKLALPVGLIVGITAVSGAFVAENDAGRAFNTFPKMGDTWIPDDIFDMKPLIRNFFENTSMVQLDHRILATASLFSIGALWLSTRKLDIHPAIRSLVGSTVGMAALQVTLGVSTLLSYVPASLGTAHQAGALTLLTLMLLLNHTVRKPSMSLLKSLPQVVKTTS